MNAYVPLAWYASFTFGQLYQNRGKRDPYDVVVGSGVGSKLRCEVMTDRSVGEKRAGWNVGLIHETGSWNEFIGCCDTINYESAWLRSNSEIIKNLTHLSWRSLRRKQYRRSILLMVTNEGYTVRIKLQYHLEVKYKLVDQTVVTQPSLDHSLVNI